MPRFLCVLLVLITPALAISANAASAIFAGGCFWCMQADFDKVPGVEKTIVGYTDGKTKNPNYRLVSAGNTGHVEAVEVFYNSKQTNYKKLLDVFWKNIDPGDKGGQFCDRGHQYTAAIFYANKNQKALALASKKEIVALNKVPIVVTRIVPVSRFYPAEEYHQDYYKKNPLRYKFYRKSCGRDKRLKQLWAKLINNNTSKKSTVT